MDHAAYGDPYRGRGHGSAVDVAHVSAACGALLTLDQAELSRKLREMGFGAIVSSESRKEKSATVGVNSAKPGATRARGSMDATVWQIMEWESARSTNLRGRVRHFQVQRRAQT